MNVRKCNNIVYVLAATAIWISAAASTANAAWTVVNLHPAGATSSKANGMYGTQQAGQVDGNAAIWTGSAASFQSLGPGIATGTDGAEQSGATGANPGVWSGTPASLVNLNPYIFGGSGGAATGVFSGIQVGYSLLDFGATQHAVYWTETSGSWKDINPGGGGFSYAEGVYNAQVVGTAGMSSQHAVIWVNLPYNTIVDLNPAGATESAGYGVFYGKQVGWASFSFIKHAALWSNTAASFVDLNPAGASASEAYGVYTTPFASQQAGYAMVGGVPHASFWNSSAGTWEDLQTYLPAEYTSSVATDVWTVNSGISYVTGYAVNGDGNTEAMLWVSPVPEPTSLLLLAPVATLALLRRRRPARCQHGTVRSKGVPV